MESMDWKIVFMCVHPKTGSITLFTNRYKEELVILQSIGIIVIKSKQTRIGIKCSLEYQQV